MTLTETFVRQRRQTVHDTLLAVVVEVLDAEYGFGNEAMPGSPAARERRLMDGEFPRRVPELAEPCTAAHRLAAACLVQSFDALVGLVDLVDGEHVLPFAFHSLARTVVESAARADWLIGNPTTHGGEPASVAIDRVVRAVKLMEWSRNEARKFDKLAVDGLEASGSVEPLGRIANESLTACVLISSMPTLRAR